ncbi:MAG: alpha/beta fold hydrolase [Gammaproteobacteria bacterium]|nr:alpha/beta fold hydrolase [Gammaproteobacteria bacterium]
MIHGPAGELEVVVSKTQEVPRQAWGIVCHPHPLHGGTLQNKVVTTLAKTFQHLGVNTVRFNFRGVGKSTGSYDQGNGELDDLFAVIDWVLHEKPSHRIWLAGFSFGAYIAMKAASRIPVEKLVVVAPPVNHFSFKSIPPITYPWIVVQGMKDEVVPPEKVLKWAKKRKPPPLILTFPEASHFFHGQLVDLRTGLEEVLGAG